MSSRGHLLGNDLPESCALGRGVCKQRTARSIEESPAAVVIPPPGDSTALALAFPLDEDELDAMAEIERAAQDIGDA
jgi:hypothetical protein